MQLNSLPYLEASIEDFHEAMAKTREVSPANKRHSVLLLEEAFEFAFYQKLDMLGQDVYRAGQNTIGINSAIDLIKKKGIGLLFLNAVRKVQKLRGDAKHHAQVPAEKEYVSLLEKARVSYSAFLFENFWEDLRDDLFEIRLMPYHEALFVHCEYLKSHQREVACRQMVSACIHRIKALLGDREVVRTWVIHEMCDLIAILKNLHGRLGGVSVKADLIDSIYQAVNNLDASVTGQDTDEVYRQTKKVYGLLSEAFPSVYDLELSLMLTDRLAPVHVPRGLTHWTALQPNDSEEFKGLQKDMADLLSQSPELLAALGAPSFEDEFDGRRLESWDLAVFDGYRWHSVMLTNGPDWPLLPESGDSEDEMTTKRRESVAQAVFDELGKLEGKRASSSKKSA